MGFFDRFTAKKPAPAPGPASATPAPATSGESRPDTAAAPGPGGVKPRLVSAREQLEAKDLAGAVAIYEEVLASAGDRADVLVTISGDLGAHGHVAQIIELIAPRYDAERHGPATGLNLLQAYLAVRDPDAAQHVLDILFSLKRPELEERLYGFSNAIAELMAAPHPAASDGENGVAPTVSKVGLITISKPIWAYGLEAMTAEILPAKDGRLRRIAFAQFAIPGHPDIDAAINRPEDELARLSRALPLWFAETFYLSANYAPYAALGIITPPNLPTRYMIFGAEWTTDNLRQLVDTHQGSLDYIFTGALRMVDADYELVLRVYEVKSFRERKKFTLRWTPATADQQLGQFQAELRRFMEWSPAAGGLAYAPPASPRAWLETLGAAVGLFVVEKKILPLELLPPVATDLERAAATAATTETASLAFLTMRARAATLGVAAPQSVALAQSPIVEKAAATLPA
jgi:hypothetical protein